MNKIFNINHFETLDNDLNVSLEKYGLVVRNERSDEYLCYYKVNDLNYDYGFIRESELNELLDLKLWINEESRNKFLEFCDQKLEDYKKLPFIHKLFGMLNYFKVEEIMGKCFDPMTVSDVIMEIKNY
jgi:hypothetical protein